MKHGFSLVELSIVLVILGLLTGGILTGQSLIRSAELRSVTTEEGRYVVAVQSFRNKYLALPGDITNATSFWNEQAAGAACASTASTTSLTCNGNGDGLINYSTNSNEMFRFWQHLANAGLIAGSYNGVRLETNDRSTGAGNAPQGRFGQSYWFIEDGVPREAGNTRYFRAIYGNYFMHGSLSNNNPPALPLISPAELWSVDTKVDDGRPATGSLMAYRHDECTNSGGDPTQINAEYLVSVSDPHCAIIFPRPF